MWVHRHLPAVGPTAEGEPFNVTEKSGGMLNELEKAHIYIEQLHHRLARLEAALVDTVRPAAARQVPASYLT